MLSASVPGMFLHHFMWISVLKLSFCVFDEDGRSVYQARHAGTCHMMAGIEETLSIAAFALLCCILGLFVSLSLLDRPIVLVSSV